MKEMKQWKAMAAGAAMAAVLTAGGGSGSGRGRGYDHVCEFQCLRRAGGNT